MIRPVEEAALRLRVGSDRASLSRRRANQIILEIALPMSYDDDVARGPADCRVSSVRFATIFSFE